MKLNARYYREPALAVCKDCVLDRNGKASVWVAPTNSRFDTAAVRAEAAKHASDEQHDVLMTFAARLWLKGSIAAAKAVAS